jgi:hypothetical protein
LDRYPLIAEARQEFNHNPENWRGYTDEIKNTFDESDDPFLQLEIATVAMACGLPVPGWAAAPIASALANRVIFA